MRGLTILLLILCLSGCATPSQHFDRVADELGFSSEIVSTTQFKHQIYSARNLMEVKTLHVYLDGDGTPWERNRWVAYDPTARNPLILKLMVQDNTPAILLGRPCYYGLNQNSGCDSKYWTSHRYSEDVINSMALALNTWLAKHDYNNVVLIGYSGGGSIAVLIADRIQNIKKVVTLAANLNVRRWGEFHGYSELKSSLNPADEGELNQKIKQFHFAGENDQVVPAFIIKNYAKSQIHANYYELSGSDHACCWEEEWKKILEVIEE